MANSPPEELYKVIMSDKRGSDNSLERGLDYEDIMSKTGRSSQNRREEAQEEKKKKEEDERQEAMKGLMLQAGRSSRSKRDAARK